MISTRIVRLTEMKARRAWQLFFLVSCLMQGCATKTENTGIHMATLKNSDLILLEQKSENMPTVEIRGPGFVKNGYVVWHSGLSLSDIETAIGYNREYPLPIAVTVHRNGREIFGARATWPEQSGGINKGPVQEKPNAPALAPGDTILASDPRDF